MARKSKTSWVPAFRYFFSLIKVSSKELTEPGPITLYRAQEIALDEIVEGLENGQHFFVALKARQLGISTILLALDIFWLYMHPGLQGALIFDTGENREQARQTITEMLESLPTKYRIPIKKHDRNMLVLANGSRLQYMNAGKGKNSGLGRSRALNFVHASEVSSWGDQKGIDSLVRALSETNPNRLYVMESTALGFNAFYDMYQKAREMPDQRAFFIGWWAKDTYAYAEGSKGYDRWWGENPNLTEDEAEKVQMVKTLYGFDVTAPQIAWYRAQEYDSSGASLAEELPWYELESWQATGSPFFSQKRLTDDLNFISAAKIGFKGFRYELGEKFFSMRIEPCDSVDGLDLRVWEEPRPTGKYVIGVDTAFGRNADADQTVISVFRGFSDMLVQVAEFATNRPETQQTAWVMAHLAGVYRDCMINLEINGPGGEVMMNLKHLREQMVFGDLAEPARKLGQAQCLDNARWFLWKKPDTMGHGYAYNFSTNFNSKAVALNKLRDHYNTSRLIIRSRPLLEEMMTLKQDGDSIGASGRNKDDRVMGCALATYAWDEWMRAALTVEGRTYEKEMAADKARMEDGDRPVVEHLVQNFFTQQAKIRSDAQLRQLLGGNI